MLEFLMDMGVKEEGIVSSPHCCSLPFCAFPPPFHCSPPQGTRVLALPMSQSQDMLDTANQARLSDLHGTTSFTSWKIFTFVIFGLLSFSSTSHDGSTSGQDTHSKNST